MFVFKFGGTSVGSSERIQGVVDIIVSHLEHQPVVVVSAMSGTTNALIAGARAAAEGETERYRSLRDELLQKHMRVVDTLLYSSSQERIELAGYVEDRLHEYGQLCRSIAILGEFTLRVHDAVASIGEELSSRILAAVLRAQGHRARAISATTLVRTNDQFGSATPDMAATRKQVQTSLLPLIDDGVIPIVTGYIGATARGITTTLGRGGSDFSAAILGASLDAQEVWIWTDVDGILTADPKLVPDAQTLPELSYKEAEELAYFGATVLHPKTVAPLAHSGTPLRIMNSFQPGSPGTLIVSQPRPDRAVLPAIITTEGLSLIALSGNGSAWSLGMASRALQALAEAGVDVLMFSQAFTERNLNLVVWDRDQEHSIGTLQRAFEHDLDLGLLSEISVREQVATLSVVGMPDSRETTITSQAFAAFGELGLRVIAVAQAASAYSLSFVIAESDVARAVPAIHTRLGL